MDWCVLAGKQINIDTLSRRWCSYELRLEEWVDSRSVSLWHCSCWGCCCWVPWRPSPSSFGGLKGPTRRIWWTLYLANRMWNSSSTQATSLWARATGEHSSTGLWRRITRKRHPSRWHSGSMEVRSDSVQKSLPLCVLQEKKFVCCGLVGFNLPKAACNPSKSLTAGFCETEERFSIESKALTLPSMTLYDAITWALGGIWWIWVVSLFSTPWVNLPWPGRHSPKL